MCAILTLTAFLCVASAATYSAEPSHAEVFANVVKSSGHSQGFANADPKRDESLRILTKSSLRQPHGHHDVVPARPGPGGDEKGRAIQREIESMVDRVHLLSNTDADAFAKELDGVESSLSHMSTDKGLMKEIEVVRGKLCADKGFQGSSLGACEVFMHKACVEDTMGDHANSISAVPEDECLKFFAEARGSAPAPAIAGSPMAASPAPAPGPDLFGSKVGRLLPEQGFDGPLVEHKNFDTHTGDWRQEFGPSSGHRSFRAICADHPNNEWCRLHGYLDEERELQDMKAGAEREVRPLVTVAALIAFNTWFFSQL